MKRERLLLSEYSVPECLVLEIGPDEMICVSNGTLDGFEEEDDEDFFN